LARAGEHITPTRPRSPDLSPSGPRRPSIRLRGRAADGAIAGFFLTTAFTAVSFAGWKLAGLPFAPFDIFDWVVRLLPGAVATAAIDASVALTRALSITDISGAAKIGDQALAIVVLLVGGVVLGAMLFALLSFSSEPALLLGAILGAILAGVALIAEHRLLRLPPGSFAPGAWVFTTFLLWGISFGWAHDHLKLSTTEDTEDTEVKPARRQFLRTLTLVSIAVSAVSTGIGIVAARIGRRFAGRRWSDDHPLPNADAQVMPLTGTRPEFTPLEDFYRIDTDTRAPALDEGHWRLTIGGLVERQQTLTLTELRDIEPIDLFATLSCISNPIGGNLISTTRWTGVSLQRLLPRLGLQPSATHLKLTSADGFFESIALDTIRADRRVMLAYAWDGVPLPVEHGFPLRLFLPDVYGMKQPKWIVGLDAVARWEPGYWVIRGWSKDGRVSVTSAIDAVDVTRLDVVVVGVGGIAFGGVRGIAKVEVRLDDGEWRPAQLRRPLSELTWVMWRAEVRVDAGQHVLTVRAFDGAGQVQTSALHARRFLL